MSLRKSFAEVSEGNSWEGNQNPGPPQIPCGNEAMGPGIGIDHKGALWGREQGLPRYGGRSGRLQVHVDSGSPRPWLTLLRDHPCPLSPQDGCDTHDRMYVEARFANDKVLHSAHLAVTIGVMWSWKKMRGLQGLVPHDVP